MYFQYSTSECKFFVALQLFLATEFRPKVSAEIRHFSPKVSVSAESQIPTLGRTLLEDLGGPRRTLEDLGGPWGSIFGSPNF